VPMYRYQLGNHLGSSMLEVDETGLVISYEEYTPYGASAYQAARSGVDVSARRYRYTGKERDEETGLYYNGARYLAAWLGRWTSADPIGIGADGPGLYNYTRGSPVMMSDPSGLAPENVWNKRAATQTAAQQDANLHQAGEAAETMGYAALEFWNRRVDEAEWLGNAWLDAAGSTEVGLARDWHAPPPEPISLDAIKVDDIPEDAKTVADVYEVGAAVVGGAAIVKGGIKLGAKALKLIFKEASATKKVVNGSRKLVNEAEELLDASDRPSVPGAPDPGKPVPHGSGAASPGDFVEKVVNSNMGHAETRAVERAGFKDAKEARRALQEFGQKLQERGTLPAEGIYDPAHADRVIIPGFGDGGAVVYQVTESGVYKLKSVLIWEPPPGWAPPINWQPLGGPPP